MVNGSVDMFLKVNRSYLQENQPAKLFVTAHIDVKRTSMARTLTCFLIDTSGSMQGAPLYWAKEAVKSGIDSLGTNDFVSVISLLFVVKVGIINNIPRNKVNSVLNDLFIALFFQKYMELL